MDPAATIPQSSDTVSFIITNALMSRASDIHFQGDRDQFNVRFRVDGFLYPFQTYEASSAQEIISRVKILSKLDTAEHRLPQDGHFEFKYQNQIINIRVSILPTSYGEAVVMRLHSREGMLLKLESMGFDQSQLILLNNLVNSRSGMILTTGPTGSGKSTLLYSILNKLNTQNRNLMSVEDPIELQMVNVRQTQVEEGVGLTFAKILRSVVRQDPDVVMIGEIRDNETAQISIQSALSGTLVLSTFHTFDVPALAARFMEMGVPGSIVAQAIRGVIACRLVRTNCPHCKITYQLNASEQKLFDSLKTSLNNSQPNFQRGKGCEKCQGKGYLGRTGIFEVVYFDEYIRACILERRPVSFIYDLIKRRKIKSLKDAALEKVINGITTFDEVSRVVDLFQEMHMAEVDKVG